MTITRMCLTETGGQMAQVGGGKPFGEVRDVKCFNFLPCQQNLVKQGDILNFVYNSGAKSLSPFPYELFPGPYL